MPRWTRIVLIVVLAVFGLMLLSILVVPWQVKQQGSAWIVDNTTRTLTIDEVSFNPFTLTLEVNGVNLSEAGGEGTFCSFDRLLVSVSANSLLEQALIIDRLELDRPFVAVERRAEEEFNFSDFTRSGAERPKRSDPEARDPFRFSLNNLVLSDGGIDFSDLTSAEPLHHRIRQLNFSLPVIGNVPYQVQQDVQPHLRLLLNGSKVEASGRSKPFSHSLGTVLEFSAQNLDLNYYARNLPLALPLTVEQGGLDLDLELIYRLSPEQVPELQLVGTVAVNDLKLNELSGRPLLQWFRLAVDLKRAKLFRQEFELASLAVLQPRLFIDRDQQARWNVQRVLDHLKKPERVATTAADASSAEATQNKLPLVLIDQLTVNQGTVDFADARAGSGFSEQVTNLDVRLEHLTTRPQEQTALNLDLTTAGGLDLGIQGDIGLVPLSTDLQVAAKALSLGPLYPYLQPYLSAPLEGTLAISSDLRYSQEEGLRLSSTDLDVTDLVIPFSDADGLELPRFSLSDSSLNLQQRRVTLGAARFEEGLLKISRLADGKLSAVKLLAEQPAPAANPGVQEQAKSRTEQGWTISLASLDLDRWQIDYRDLALPKQPQLTIKSLTGHAENLSFPEPRPSPFRLNLQVGEQGTVAITGTVTHSPLEVTASTTVEAFPLTDFNAFIPPRFKFSLHSGALHSNLEATLQQLPDSWQGHFSGQLDISQFSLNDPLDQGELLSWGSLNLAGIEGRIAPLDLRIQEVALSDYRTNILITPEGRINLTSMTAEEASLEADQQPPEPVATAPEAEVVNTTREAETSIRIDALTLQGGTVSFVDQSMETPFSTTMYELGGRVSGLSADPAVRADVDLRGQLENLSPLTISGTINPLSRNLFVDLTISFKNIDLTPLTPYSGTYLGYRIAKGKLFLDMTYKIEKNRLNADNQILIDQLTLGDSVASDQATSLPVGLAIALLKNASGEIHLDVPVRGNLNDPQFSVTGVIFTVLKNLLVKAATSPFSLLASMFGGEQDFSAVSFAPGSAELAAEQQEKLAKLAEMLVQRPSLDLEISAFIDPQQDPEAYRQRQLRRQLLEIRQQQLAMVPHSEAAPDQEISPEERSLLLTGLYRTASFPRPRNADGTLTELPPEEMEKLLLTHILAGEFQMTELARARANAVQTALGAASEEIRPRLFLKPPEDINRLPADDQDPASRVEFGISAE